MINDVMKGLKESNHIKVIVIALCCVNIENRSENKRFISIMKKSHLKLAMLLERPRDMFNDVMTGLKKKVAILK